MRLEIVAFTPPGLVRAEDSLRLKTVMMKAKKDINYTILLPVPQGVQDTRSADWQDVEMGSFRCIARCWLIQDWKQMVVLLVSLKSGTWRNSWSIQALTDHKQNRSTTSNLLTAGICSINCKCNHRWWNADAEEFIKDKLD